MQYVIIGGGTAAVGTIEGIRAVDRTGPITLISAEPYPVYGRPLISYLLQGKTTEEKMFGYRPADFYEKNGVTPHLGQTVQAVDAAAKTVTLESGETFPYDKLCICTGSRPFVPPMEGLDQVREQTSFMTLDDAKNLDHMLGNANDKRVLIVGAGLIGLKCAEGILERAQSVTVIDMAPRILPNVMLERPAAIIQKHLERKGVVFHLSDSVARFDTPTHAILQSGLGIDFDVLVVAVGVRPNTGLAEMAGCAVDRGIRLDDHMQTTVPDIYAAGDCTLSHDISCDTDRILAILPGAYMQGETAGRNMAGGNATFDKAIPMNASGFLGLHMVTAGSYEGTQYLDDNEDGYKLLVTRDDHLVGFILLGDIERAGIYTSLIRERTPLSSIDFDLIREKPQLMAFSSTERAKKLGGARAW